MLVQWKHGAKKDNNENSELKPISNSTIQALCILSFHLFFSVHLQLHVTLREYNSCLLFHLLLNLCLLLFYLSTFASGVRLYIGRCCLRAIPETLSIFIRFRLTVATVVVVIYHERSGCWSP